MQSNISIFGALTSQMIIEMIVEIANVLIKPQDLYFYKI